jgi:hypothetical protein
MKNSTEIKSSPAECYYVLMLAVLFYRTFCIKRDAKTPVVLLECMLM